MASSLVDRVNALERRLARIEQFTSPIADDVVDEILALVDRAQAPIEAVDVARRLAIPLSTAVEVLQDLARLGLVEECRAGRATSTISRKFSPRKLT
jgi:Mn-dependent DtxR family transcriptional regulator